MEIRYKDLFEKYGLFFDGQKRFYKENIYERDYLLECSSPYKLKVMGIEFKENSWLHLIVELSIFLNKKFPDKDLLTFKSTWNKFTAFVNKSLGSYTKFICPGVYLYANYSAKHACWFIQDILDFYNVNLDDVELIIHRNPYGEPFDVREKILSETKNNFKEYLLTSYSIGEAKSEKIIKNIDYLNELLAEISHGYDNFFLFDNSATYATMKSKFLQKFRGTRMAENPKNRELVSRYLNYLTNFYRDLGY